MADQKPKSQVQTIEITNFGGRLTRILNGDLNSGFAKFATSWGYDPFSKPMNLTWLSQPTDITGPIQGMVIAAKPRFENVVSSIVGEQYLYVLTTNSSQNLYKVLTTSNSSSFENSVVGIASITAGGPTFNYGGSIDTFGFAEKLYVGSDEQVNSINFDGSGDQVVSSMNGYIPGNRPLKQFVGKLIFGNGPTIGAIDATLGVTSSIFAVSSTLANGLHAYSQISPILPADYFVQDLDVSPDYNYLMISASRQNPENISSPLADTQGQSPSDSGIFMWNGSDPGVTAANTLPSGGVTALQTYLQNNIFFGNDTFGSYINDGTNKILTLPNNKSPYRNAVGSNGNFMFWICPESIPINNTTYNRVASMYYFGSLDQENPPGLYRLMRFSTSLSNGFVYQAPLNILATNDYVSFINPGLIEKQSAGTHYFSVYSVAGSNGSTGSFQFLCFFVTSNVVFGSPAQAGVYETQTQLFSKKITVKQVRVYCEPTIANNGFQIDFIGSDGSPITNGTFNYTFAAGSDPTQAQGALDRIDWNPSMENTYALGFRITNTGAANMTVHKIEIDYGPSGK